VEGEELTQQTVEDSAAAPEAGEGSSFESQLPEELRPYSMIPWDRIPQEQWDSVLKGVKEFHGGMTKGQQELAQVRRKLPELERRSQMLEKLVNEPWVREAWEAHQRGEKIGGPKKPESPPLGEHFDPDQAKTLEATISNAVERRFGELAVQLQSLQHQQTQTQAARDLEGLRVSAEKQGLPSPDTVLERMYSLVSSGQARDINSAYRLAIFEDLPSLMEQAKKTAINGLQKKASSAPAPNLGINGTPGRELFVGKDSTLRALESAMSETGISL
jgi:hypothetical protein